MEVDFFGSSVRAETNGYLVSLNDLFTAGNVWRLQNGKAVLQLGSFLNSKGLSEYIDAACKEWGLSEDSFVKRVGKGKYTRTMVHLSVAILAAEYISPVFHARVHREFIEGKLLEFRSLGSTEFTTLNAAIDQYLPGREGKDNKGVFIGVAVKLREKILGKGATTESWNKAPVGQTQLRFDIEKKLSWSLKAGLIKDYDHLKAVIEAL